MKDTAGRINNIVGQLKGVEKMVTDGKNCEEVLIQLRSIKAAINSLIGKYFEDSFDKCLDSQKQEDKDTLRIIFRQLNN